MKGWDPQNREVTPVELMSYFFFLKENKSVFTENIKKIIYEHFS